VYSIKWFYIVIYQACYSLVKDTDILEILQVFIIGCPKCLM